MIDSKFKVIKPEDIVIKNRYSFSFNPEEQPKPQRFYNVTLNCFESWSQKVYEVFASLRFAEVETFMEISKGGRLHFHGYIKVNDIPSFYFYEIPKLKHYGTFEIDIINDPMLWDLYIKKQKSFMSKFCKKNRMQYMFP